MVNKPVRLRCNAIRLNTVQVTALHHALEVAHRTFSEDVEIWKKATPNEFVTGGGIASLLELFRSYRQDTLQLIQQLDGAKHIAVIVDEDERGGER